jgi:hypothetical protein
MRRPAALCAVFVLGWSTCAAGQPQVAVRPAPQPGQVIHVTTGQEFMVRMGERAEEPGPAHLWSKGTLVYTQTNGHFDADDRMEAQIRIQRLEIEDSMRQPEAMNRLAATAQGRVLVVVFDRSGKLLSIKVPPDMADVSSRLTQLLAGAYGVLNFLPVADLAVGQETTSTAELPLRLPGALAQGPLEARTNLSLRSIDTRGTDRVARLHQSIDVATTTSQVTMSGGGTIDVNLDRGFVTGANTEWRISGVIPTSGAGQSPPFYGSFKISISAN